MSPWCTSRAIPNPGSSPCPSRRPRTAPSTTGSGGASRPCSRTSRPAASAWKTATSSAPSAWSACSWSWSWPSSGPFPPACGTPPPRPRPTKKSPSAPAPQPPPQPDLALQARHPTTSDLPTTSRSATAAVERLGELMGGEGRQGERLALVAQVLRRHVREQPAPGLRVELGLDVLRVDAGVPVEPLDDVVGLDLGAGGELDELLGQLGVGGLLRHDVVHGLARQARPDQVELEVGVETAVRLPGVEHVDPDRAH